MNIPLSNEIRPEILLTNSDQNAIRHAMAHIVLLAQAEGKPQLAAAFINLTYRKVFK